MDNYLAFLEESGGHGFDFTKLGTSAYFVVCAIIVDEAKADELETNFLRIKKSYFPDSELKSSKIGNRDRRRQKMDIPVILTPIPGY